MPIQFLPHKEDGVMNKILIFGISGFVGSYLAQEFLQNGYEVCGSDIAERGRLSEQVRFYRVDLLDAQAVSHLVEQIQPRVIINLAAISNVGKSWSIPQAAMSVNVIGGLNILEAARVCKSAPKVMFIGSSEEYQPSDKPISEANPLNANNPYGISKIAQESFAALYRQRYGMKVYCVRPFNHTGIGQTDDFVLPSFCKQVADIAKSGKAGVIRVGNLSAERDFSNVKDVVKAYRMIIERGDCSLVYNIGTGNAYSIKDILDYIISLCPQRVTVEIDSNRFRPVDTARICCDCTLLRKSLDWKPEYSIFDTVKEMYEYYVDFDDIFM